MTTVTMSRRRAGPKRAFVVLSVTFLLAVLAAVYTAGSSAVVTATDTPTFAVVTAVQHPYYNKTKEAMGPTCAAIGCKYIFVQPQKCDAQSESQVIRDVVARGIDGLAVAACDAKGIEPTVRQAARSGIPIVTFDADCCKSTRKIAISNSDRQIGQNHARIVNQLLPRGGNVAVTEASLTFLNERARLAGFKSLVNKNIKVKVYTGETSPEQTATLIRDIMTKDPDTDLIVDQAGYGSVVAQTLKQDGYKPGEVQLVTINDFPDIIQFVKNGYITATVALNSGLQGELALRSLKMLLDGKTPKKTFVGTPSGIITKKTLNTYKRQVARDNAAFTKTFTALWR